MRKVLAFSLGVLVAGSAFAQEPAEVPLFFAVVIPAGALPTIDGDHSDWGWVDKSFEVTIDDMNPLTGGADDADDLFVDLMIGWSDANNRVSAAIHVHDNDLIVDKNPTCTFRDDNCEVHFDPDNGGGGPYSAPNDQDLQPAYQMCLSFSEQFPRVQMYNGALGNFEQDALDFWWTHSGDFVTAGHVNQGQEYYYEFSAEMFDPISISGGPDASTKFTLAAEQSIGLSISMDLSYGIFTVVTCPSQIPLAERIKSGLATYATVVISKQLGASCLRLIEELFETNLVTPDESTVTMLNQGFL